jgi:hypothetical protein
MVRREVVEKVGGLDERFFMYHEDMDWCRRIGDAGYGVYCVPQARVVHHEGQSERSGAEGPRPARLVWAFHQSAYYYFTKHHAPERWNPFRLVAAAGFGARAAVIVLANAIANKLPFRSSPAPRRGLGQQPR